jgi:hypothetical protein
MYRKQRWAIVLAAAPLIGCNSASLLRKLPEMSVHLPRSPSTAATRRRPGNPLQAPRAAAREKRLAGARAVLLALLVLGTGVALAQPASAPAAVPSTTAAAAPAQSSGAPSAPLVAQPWTIAQIDDAFQMTDTDRNGVISRQEASIWTGLSRNFDLVDTNRDGVISRAEFEQRLR